MRTKIFNFILVFIVLSIFISPQELPCAPYYQGKVLRILVAFPPGGGYDRMGRLLSRYLPKHIPGKPTTIVENMPGASSMIGCNYMYSVAKPDGLTIGTFNRAIPTAQLLKVSGANFDMLKYSWVGSAAVETTVLALRTDLPYKTLEDVKKAKDPIAIGTTGPGDLTYNFPILVKNFLDLNLKLVTGYIATSDILLATERKEVDGYASAYTSIAPHVARGVIRPVLRTKIPNPATDKLPAVEDLATGKMGKTIMEMFSVADKVGRPYVAAPGTPPEIMAILRDAFAKVAKDPELKADAQKLMMDVEYVPASECLKAIQFLFSQPPDVVAEFGKYIKF
ncbi:MAG: Bug family tripartite tricarboxylate transporter substrate binding protein [Thermodesulfobacteriota bacterium]